MTANKQMQLERDLVQGVFESEHGRHRAAYVIMTVAHRSPLCCVLHAPHPQDCVPHPPQPQHPSAGHLGLAVAPVMQLRLITAWREWKRFPG